MAAPAESLAGEPARRQASGLPPQSLLMVLRALS